MDNLLKVHHLSEMRKIVDQLLDAKRESGKTEAVEAARHYEHAHSLTLITVALGLVVAGIAAVFSVMGISRAIERITRSISQLARGDISTAVSAFSAMRRGSRKPGK